jgi:aarF domain-containing kinase
VETFEEGEPLANFLNSNTKRSEEKTHLARLGLKAYLKMMLIDNFVHADLHPGIVYVLFVKFLFFVDKFFQTF